MKIPLLPKNLGKKSVNQGTMTGSRQPPTLPLCKASLPLSLHKYKENSFISQGTLHNLLKATTLLLALKSTRRLTMQKN